MFGNNFNKKKNQVLYTTNYRISLREIKYLNQGYN